MAWAFSDEIHSLTNYNADDGDAGSAISGETLAAHTAQWLSDGAQEVSARLPIDLQEECTTYASQTNANGFNVALAIKVTSVVRHDGTSYQICRKVPTSLWSRVSDSNDILYATADDPVYYIDYDGSSRNELYIKPDPESGYKGRVYYIPEYSVAGTATAIDNFPQVAEPLVILYASMKALCYKMSEMHILVPEHSDQDLSDSGSYASATDGKNQGWEQIRHWIENEEDSELAAVNTQSLTTEMQQFIAEYQWYQSKHQMLKMEYEEGLARLSGVPMTPQQPREREGR
tara:strand:+ start:33302 stop:34165 length:864 start_codon:yes stop_codon:yes gene_type:complete